MDLRLKQCAAADVIIWVLNAIGVVLLLWTENHSFRLDPGWPHLDGRH